MNYEFPPEDDAHPRRLLECLLETHQELADIRSLEPKVAVIFRRDEKVKQGRMVLGTCYIPMVQGELRGLFEDLLTEKLGFWPDFLIVLSKPFWEVATERQREVLMFHEMLHMGQDTDKYGTPRFNLQTGEPIFGIVGHDIEEFRVVVARYGAWSPDITAFLAAARQGVPKER